MPSSKIKRKKRVARQAPINLDEKDVDKTGCTAMSPIFPDSIKGVDDEGNFYSSHAELETVQLKNRALWYEANKQWWLNGGYGGLTDDEAMIGDEGGLQDGEEGLDFLDRLLSSHPLKRYRRAIDAGAGVGRITKLVLLKRFDSVHLIEADYGWSKRSRAYLGRKRANRCTFTCCRLENVDVESSGGQKTDLIWLQWTLQYLTDADAVNTLCNLSKSLTDDTGMLVVKENRPYGNARVDRFQLETPAGSGRYDITRSDAHHRLLFQRAGMQVCVSEQGDETNTYAICCS